MADRADTCLLRDYAHRSKHRGGSPGLSDAAQGSTKTGALHSAGVAWLEWSGLVEDSIETVSVVREGCHATT